MCFCQIFSFIILKNIFKIKFLSITKNSFNNGEDTNTLENKLINKYENKSLL